MKKIIVLLAVLSSLAFTFKSNKFSKLKSFVYIPSGSTILDDETYSCNAFYMATTEVTNANYREFLNDLVKEGRTEDYKIALPDTNQWIRNEFRFSTALQSHYFRHPAYEGYPVVNVSKEGANMYCIWLTQKMSAMFPNDNLNDFRLPTKEEWVYAAKGGFKNSTYPWGSVETTNSDGDVQANFMRIGEQNIKRDSTGRIAVVSKEEFRCTSADDWAEVLAPVKSYWPNNFGLYNMSGNCAELVAKEDIAMGGSWRSPGHDIRVTSSQQFLEANPMVGFRPVMTFLNVE